MKKIILTVLTCFCCVTFLMAQNQVANLEKYWNYRERLRQRFIVINENVEQFGVNIPASSINLDAGIIGWGDANNGMSHYLSMLATELWLLKNNGQDYSLTLKELYYAMLAMERLDYYSEYSWRLKANVPASVSPTDRNGLHVRDDVSTGFWNSYNSHFPVPLFESVYKGDPSDPPTVMEEISQDNIYHNMEGLALVSKLVGTELVAGIPVTFVSQDTPNYLAQQGIQSGSSINFSLWAQDFVKRYISYMQSCAFGWRYEVLGVKVASLTDHWALINPVTGQFVLEGSGEDFDMGIFYNAGVIKAGEAITGENLRTQDAFIISNSLSENVFKDLFILGPVQTTLEFQPWPWPFDQWFDPIEINLLFDDYKVRSLGANGNIIDNQTLSVLRNSRDKNNVFDYEHLPLMYSVLHDPNSQYMFPGNNVYTNDRVIIENLLNTAPSGGPKSNGNINWSSDSRLVWPEKLGQRASENVEFSGLDYMVLHNLYYIAFRREDFSNLIIQNNSLHNAIFGNGTFRYRTITASNRIPSSGNASYYGSQSVSLKPGFTAPSGSIFMAKAESRADNYQGALYKLPNPSGGRIKVESFNEAGKINEVYKATFKLDLEKPNTSIMTYLKTEEDLSIDKVKVSPVPANTTLHITLHAAHEGELKIELLSLKGQLLMTQYLNRSDQDIDVSGIASGIYVLKIYTSEKIEIVKFSIVH